MSVQHIVESKYFKAGAIVGGVLFVALLSFALGVNVGFYKASFSARFGENYERNFLGGDMRDGRMSRLGKMMDADDRGMRNPHGVGGEILSVSGDTVIIRNRKNQENSIRMDDKTIINRGKQTVTINDLAPGQNIIVVGKPGDDGVVLARLIRVFKK